MAKNISFQLGKNPKQTQLLAVLLLVLVAGGFIYWRYYSSNPPQAMDSSANEELMHWPHSGTPFTLEVANFAGRTWEKDIIANGDVWSKAGMIDFNVNLQSGKFQCVPIELPPSFTGVNICSYNDDDEWLSIRGIFGHTGDPHITAGLVVLNDYYLSNRNSEYATKVWRNKILCSGMGWIVGIPIRDPIDHPTSCMNYEIDSDTVAQQQYPSDKDFSYMTELYKHIDYDEVKGIATDLSKLQKQTLTPTNMGQLTNSYTINGVTTEIYQMDLGEGFYFTTNLQKLAQ